MHLSIRYRKSSQRTLSRASASACAVEPLEGRVLFSTYTVTGLGDSAGSITSAGTGKFNATTLRAALNAANSHSGADTIRFASGVTGTISLGKALPTVSSDLTLIGPGTSKLAVQRGSSATSDFPVLRIGSGRTAVVSGLRFAHGTGLLHSSPNASSPIADGGGIYNEGSLTMTSCSVTGNHVSGSGAGIYNHLAGATLKMVNCTISSNQVEYGGDGGGIYNEHGSITLILCTLSDNGGNDGGAIKNDAGTMSLGSCTFTGNGAFEFGGGGGVDNSPGSVADVANCTFFDNAAGFGGAIINAAVMTVTNCTISGNTSEAGFNKFTGGGISTGGGGSSLTIHNSIIVGNKRSQDLQSDEIDGTVQSTSSNNIVGTIGKGGLFNGVNGNKVGISLSALKLGVLASNGGKTQTMALLTGSPAINAGSNVKAAAAKLYADQRGLPRVENGTVDIGAYEVQIRGRSISGTVFNDTNHDGIFQFGEFGLADWQVYIDQNNDGVYNRGELTTFTSSTGTYTFTSLPAGTYRVREVLPPGWTSTKPTGGSYSVTFGVSDLGGVTGKDFGNYLTA